MPGMTLSSPAFADGARIPDEYTCEGADVSPPLSWQHPPPGTRSFALVVEDPDAPTRTWTHWLAWNIDGSASSLQKNAAALDLVFGTTDFGRIAWNGPCPPTGHGVHRYFFRLYALDLTELGLEQGADRKALDDAMRGHILGEAVLVGTYERVQDPVAGT